jgi:hypothetical protein
MWPVIVGGPLDVLGVASRVAQRAARIGRPFQKRLVSV